jgi:hypothetical protein
MRRSAYWSRLGCVPTLWSERHCRRHWRSSRRLCSVPLLLRGRRCTRILQLRCRSDRFPIARRHDTIWIVVIGPLCRSAMVAVTVQGVSDGYTLSRLIMVTYVSVFGWKVGAVGLSLVPALSCGCGVLDLPGVLPPAPLVGVGDGLGGSGIFGQSVRCCSTL